jgi:hypothetical protein
VISHSGFCVNRSEDNGDCRPERSSQLHGIVERRGADDDDHPDGPAAILLTEMMQQAFFVFGPFEPVEIEMLDIERYRLSRVILDDRAHRGDDRVWPRTKRGRLVDHKN